mmetsp:Transcript_536/g.1768  ORF Transcript_536/g.1768 Transcript_536/m.1768 type:complete len:214 (+) Transcript_536:60-701(+)
MSFAAVALLLLVAPAGATRENAAAPVLAPEAPGVLLSVNRSQQAACEMVDRKYQEALAGVEQDTETSTAAACLDLCRKTPQCGKYTWFPHDGASRGNCWLHPASAKSVAYYSGWFSEGAVIGPKDCDPCIKSYMYSAQSNGYWSMEGTYEEGNLLTGECAARCRQNPKCKFWTWRDDGGRCYLSDGNAYQRHHGEPTVTGDRNCLAKTWPYAG